MKSSQLFLFFLETENTNMEMFESFSEIQKPIRRCLGFYKRNTLLDARTRITEEKYSQ